jgi:hypothetical protein
MQRDAPLGGQTGVRLGQILFFRSAKNIAIKHFTGAPTTGAIY